MSQLQVKSKTLAYVLRHKPDEFGITLGEAGWIPVAELIQKVNEAKQADYFSEDWICRIVLQDKKKRYSLRKADEQLQVRANYGHSVEIAMDYKPEMPPKILFHGTAERFVESIMKQGIVSQSRLLVHLTTDSEMAVQVGRRHGEPVVLMVNTEVAMAQGNQFFKTEGNVWLTGDISPTALM